MKDKSYKLLMFSLIRFSNIFLNATPSLFMRIEAIYVVAWNFHLQIRIKGIHGLLLVKRVTLGYEGFERVTGDYKGFQVVTRDYRVF